MTELSTSSTHSAFFACVGLAVQRTPPSQHSITRASPSAACDIRQPAWPGSQQDPSKLPVKFVSSCHSYCSWPYSGKSVPFGVAREGQDAANEMTMAMRCTKGIFQYKKPFLVLTDVDNTRNRSHPTVLVEGGVLSVLFCTRSRAGNCLHCLPLKNSGRMKPHVLWRLDVSASRPHRTQNGEECHFSETTGHVLNYPLVLL
ncbi:hypothetical protein LZ31DRAFT_357018 [Colletotrichum somersetense]|nr:hypothetical protein LZ31DRAFT_357018 [Colletotrichum somersetense]